MTDTPFSGRDVLAAFVATDPVDAGCGHTMELLHVYVESVLAGDDPEATFPGISAHLRVCGPCLEDFNGLLALLRD